MLEPDSAPITRAPPARLNGDGAPGDGFIGDSEQLLAKFNRIE